MLPFFNLHNGRNIKIDTAHAISISSKSPTNGVPKIALPSIEIMLTNTISSKTTPPKTAKISASDKTARLIEFFLNFRDRLLLLILIFFY